MKKSHIHLKSPGSHSVDTVAAINLETPRFFYCKLFVTLIMLLTYQFRLRQSVECAQR
jgi:hypothetical protein